MRKNIGCIIPHAGFDYAGDARSKVFDQFNNNNVKRIIYVASLHSVDGSGVYLIKDELRLFGNDFPIKPAKKSEHSYDWVKDELHNRFPLAKHTVIIPAQDYDYHRLSRMIQKYLVKHDDAILIGTTDLIHYDDLTGVSWKFPQQMKTYLEGPLIEAMKTSDTNKLVSLFNEQPFLGCGRYSVEFVSRVFSHFNSQGTVVSYYDSAQSEYEDTDIRRYSFNVEPITKFVSYVGIVFGEITNERSSLLSELEIKLALGSIRNVINYEIINSKVISVPVNHLIPIWTKWYSMKNGIFVGTTAGKKINCSYGTFQGTFQGTSADHIIEAAKNCYRDSVDRWNIPLTTSAKTTYKLEILQDQNNWKTIRAKNIVNYSKYDDLGYYLSFTSKRSGKVSATYLPTVWKNILHNLDAEEMLSSLAGKALGTDMSNLWKKDKNATVKLYTTKRYEFIFGQGLVINSQVGGGTEKWCFNRTIYYEASDESDEGSNEGSDENNENEQTVKYCLQDECDKFISPNWKLKDFLGMGEYGVVYNIDVLGSQTEFVVKAVPLDVIIPTLDCNLMDTSTWSDCIMVEEEKKGEFTQEAKVAKIAGEVGAGPKVLTWFICNDTLQITKKDTHPIKLGIIVMEKIGISLEKYISTYPNMLEENLDKIYKLVEDKANKLEKKSGYILNDVHDGNILVTIDDDNNVNDLFFIDYADVTEIREEGESGRTFHLFKTFMNDFLRYRFKKLL